jgi:hypothetical protein
MQQQVRLPFRCVRRQVGLESARDKQKRRRFFPRVGRDRSSGRSMLTPNVLVRSPLCCYVGVSLSCVPSLLPAATTDGKEQDIVSTIGLYRARPLLAAGFLGRNVRMLLTYTTLFFLGELLLKLL